VGAVATKSRLIPVAREAVWDTLADAGAYPEWVVGSQAIRAADPDWPAAGSRFHHTVGVGPFTVDDHTEALESRAPELLRLEAKARPVGTARVTLELLAHDGGTMVRMTEEPTGLTSLLALNPLVQLLTKARLAESLSRLEKLALRR
jgi:uncharacterized protein YndB with AHSA1/START domain